MQRLRNTIRVDVAADKVWAIVGDIGAAHTWVPGVRSCRVEGSQRICNEGEIVEEISEYSAQRRSYRYAHVRVPLPVKTSRGTFTVDAGDSGAVVVFDAEIEALDPTKESEVVQMIDGYYKQALESLRQLIMSAS